MTSSAHRADVFETLRPHLLAVAYRLTGTFADAEDTVQDAWLRWQGAADIVDPRAWLTTVVSRLSLDRLRSAAHRRESYVGHWLPEPVVTPQGRARVFVHRHAAFRVQICALAERVDQDFPPVDVLL
ncbi:hypothetical protein BH10ACT9_BH10ACT9_12000 [soil metagenome]